MIFQNTKKSQAPSYTCSHRFSSVKMLREYSITKEIMQGTSYRATTHAVSFWNTSYTGTYYAGGISPVSGMVEGSFMSVQIDSIECRMMIAGVGAAAVQGAYMLGYLPKLPKIFKPIPKFNPIYP